MYSDCATSCGITCENYFLPPHLQPVCDFLCNEGCSCPPGLIPLRSSPQDSTLCVRPDECPRPERECPPTRVFTECGSSCGITCENIHLPPRFQPVCPAFCLRGCFCEEGLIPLGPNEDRCVRPDQCPTAVCSMEREMNPCLYVCKYTHIFIECICLNPIKLGHSRICYIACHVKGTILYAPYMHINVEYLQSPWYSDAYPVYTQYVFIGITIKVTSSQSYTKIRDE